jgi:hypothetical protein
MIDRFFAALLAAIVAMGAWHTITSYCREKDEKRRWRETVQRLKFGESNASN